MKRNKGFKYRIYPTKEQEQFFVQTFGCCRFLWNKMLEDKENYYNETHKHLKVNVLQYKKEYSFLSKVDFNALNQEKQILNQAYTNFFKNPTQFNLPKFKSKKTPIQSYTTPNINKTPIIRLIDKNHIKLCKIKSLKIKLSRPLPINSIIKSATISHKGSGKWYISLLVEYEIPNYYKELDKYNSIGLDYSSKSFYVDNQGREANYPNYYYQLENKLAIEQQKLSRKVYGSHNYYKQLKRVCKVHEHITNCRDDFLHKLSHSLAEQYDVIFVEDLNMQGMAESLNFGKKVNDNSWGKFINFLSYKLEDRGKLLVKVDKWYPSSQVCNNCGAVNPITKDLKIREWKCSSCGCINERDTNAANNIRNCGTTTLLTLN